MKRLAILSLTLLFAMSVVTGQTTKTEKEKAKETKKEMKNERKQLRKLEGKEVSSIAKNNFIGDFPGATNVEWKRAETLDKATFTNKDGKKMSAFYDYDGKLVGTTYIVAFTDLPAAGQKQIKSGYKDYTIGSAIFFDDNEFNESDMELYGQQFADADNYFVELSKGTKKIVLQVNTEGVVFFFKEL